MMLGMALLERIRRATRSPNGTWLVGIWRSMVLVLLPVAIWVWDLSMLGAAIMVWCLWWRYLSMPRAAMMAWCQGRRLLDTLALLPLCRTLSMLGQAHLEMDRRVISEGLPGQPYYLC